MNLTTSSTKTFPYSRVCPFAPPKEYEHLSQGSGVAQIELATGLKVWAVTGWENTRNVLRDHRTSASRKHASFPFYFDPPQEFRTETSFIGYDGEEHARTRRLAAVTFTNRRVQMLRPRIEEIVEDRFRAFESKGSPADFHSLVSLPVPMSVICELLGIPYEDHALFQHHGSILLGGYGSSAERQSSIHAVAEYLYRLVEEKRSKPDDALLSRAIAEADRSDGYFTDRDIVNLCRLLMNGGHETTANMLSLGTAYLLNEPHVVDRLKQEPALVENVVEELVRILSIGDAAVPRVALEDIPVGETIIPAGDGILCLAMAANWDTRKFETPERIDLERADRSHLGFGYGLHHCIGADLARLEMNVVWSRLFERFPNLQLTQSISELKTKDAAIIYGLWELPVTW